MPPIVPLGAGPAQAAAAQPVEGGRARAAAPQAQAKQSWFDDAEALNPNPAVEHHGAERLQVTASSYRSALLLHQSDRFIDAFRRASPAEQERYRYDLAQVLSDRDLQAWIEADPSRRQAAESITRSMRPPDAGAGLNAEAEARMAHVDLKRYPNDVIVVPGYTPRDASVATPGVHPVGRQRLALAVQAWRAGQAPFIMVSGANVYPKGTQYYEAIEMRRELMAMGVPANAIIVEAQARHSTTNLRNAGRYMLDHGMSRALITTTGGGGGPFDQGFYMGHPTLSTFHGRSRTELGHTVGKLHVASVDPDGDAHITHISFEPSPDVRHFNYRDPLDP